MGRALKFARQALAGALLATAARAQQVSDPDFDVTVTAPAHRGTPVLFNEAHHHFHTTSGRYRPFAQLIGNDGCRVTPNHQAFTARSLSGHHVLVIANALGAASLSAPEAAHPPHLFRPAARRLVLRIYS